MMGPSHSVRIGGKNEMAGIQQNRLIIADRARGHK